MGRQLLSSRTWLINAELHSSFQWVLKHKTGVWIILPGELHLQQQLISFEYQSQIMFGKS